jgi:DNA polymerase III alpha subunit (gram-positive type)
MKKFTPYVSLDLETTGLSMESDILEIAAIYDDGGPIEELKKFHALIRYDKFKHAEMYAIGMNAELIKEGLSIGIPANNALKEFYIWLNSIRTPDSRGKLQRLYVAGKNVAGFDIPMLENNYRYYAGEANGNITQNFTHRTLDVGSMYFPYFGENVTLGKINELTGRAANVSHRAMDDAMDVVIAIRHLMKQEVYPTIG